MYGWKLSPLSPAPSSDASLPLRHPTRRHFEQIGRATSADGAQKWVRVVSGYCRRVAKYFLFLQLQDIK